MTILLVDAAGRTLTATLGDRRVVNGWVMPKWPRVVKAEIDGQGDPRGWLFRLRVKAAQEWAPPPWTTYAASDWAFSGKRLWC